MHPKAKSIRPFIGAKDYTVAKKFYTRLGFEEIVIAPNFSVFKKEDIAFYLQDYYVKDWIENTMLLIEVDDADDYFIYLLQLNLKEEFENIKLIPVKYNDWGKECMLIDPSGILWHFATFNQ